MTDFEEYFNRKLPVKMAVDWEVVPIGTIGTTKNSLPQLMLGSRRYGISVDFDQYGIWTVDISSLTLVEDN